MAKMRVHDLAKEYGMQSKEMLEHLAEMKIPAKSPSSTLEDAPTSFNVLGLTWVYAAYVIFQEGYRASHNMIIQPGCAARHAPQMRRQNLGKYRQLMRIWSSIFSLRLLLRK